MAILNSYHNERNFELPEPQLSAATSTLIQIIAGPLTFNFYGSFSYDGQGYLASGTLQGNDLWDSGNGGLQYDITGLNHDIFDVFYYVLNFDFEGLSQFLFGGDDTLNGYDEDDILPGFGGADLISGGAGNDWLDAGSDFQADTLVGGNGDDTYTIDGLEFGQPDQVIESPNAGIDTVYSRSSFVLPGNVENLILYASGNSHATGNALDNQLTGNDQDNVLAGAGGNDTLDGAGGNDTYDGGAGLDLAVYTTRHAAAIVAPNALGWGVSGPDGVESLASVERLRFSDAHLAFDIDGNAGQIYRLYAAAFARTPDLAGLGGWIAGMDSGATSLLQAAGGFIASAEFQNLYGSNPTHEQFVTALYLNVMGRAPDEEGYNHWVNQLAGALQSRAQVLIAFSESPENQAATAGLVAGGILYASAEQAAGPARGQLWNGTPGADSLIGSVGADTLQGGGGDDQLNGGAGIDIAVYGGSRASHVITVTATTGATGVGDLGVSGAAEGNDALTNIERLKFDDGALAFDFDGNAGQVYRLYQAAFDRTPDTAGLSDWLRGMDAGMSLTKVAAGFIGSAEFQALYGTSPTSGEFIELLYANVLDREPDAAGYDYWSSQMAAGMTRELVLIGFSESEENVAAVLPAIQGGIGYVA